MDASLEKALQAFCLDANSFEETLYILGQTDQVVQFRLKDGKDFYLKVSQGRITFSQGEAMPGGTNLPELVSFACDQGTATRLLTGQVAFWEAFVPLNASNVIILGELWMFKKGIVNWFGRLLRVTRETRGGNKRDFRAL